MKYLSYRKVEGCLEGTNVYDLFFDDYINNEFIDLIAVLGKLIVNDSIEKPFFKIIVRGKFTIKGSIGNKTLRLLFPEKMDYKDLDFLLKFIDIQLQNNKVMK